MKMRRSEKNPLLTPADVAPSQPGWKVECVFNAGVCSYQGETLLLLRVAESVKSAEENCLEVPLLLPVNGGWQAGTKRFQRDDPTYDFSDPRMIVLKADPSQVYLTSMSHLRLARSHNGEDFVVDAHPFITADTQYEQFGCEDPRITLIDGVYYINYSAISPYGISTALATTPDFVTVTKQGVIFCPDNRDVCFFPQKIHDRYLALTRPSPKHFGKPDIWICESPDMLHWGNHRHLLGSASGEWDALKLGGGAPLIRTPQGWLEIYHGVDKDQRYCLGAMLLDLNDPLKILAKSPAPLLQPETLYEKEGFFGNVVFTCGALLERDMLKIYYGAADECIALATMPLADLWQHLGISVSVD